MIKIKNLTQAQIDRFPEFVEKWNRIGLSTESANRKEAERGIVAMYQAGGLKPPEKIVWCGSPLSQGLTRSIILDKELINKVGHSVKESVIGPVRDSVMASIMASTGSAVWDSVKDSVWVSIRESVEVPIWDPVRTSVMIPAWDTIGDSVRQSVWESVARSVWQSVRESVGQSVRESVGQSVRQSVWQSVRQSVYESVWQSVWESAWQSVRQSVEQSVWQSVEQSVWQSVRESVRQSVRQSVEQSVWESVYGQHDAAWLGFYDYFREVCGLTEETDRLYGLFLLAQNAGWALPYKNICWVSERHNILHRDAEGRIHSMTGPAIAYPDGWSIYAVHGVRVPGWIIEDPAKINCENIDKEENAEVRRVMLDKFGWDKYLIQSGAVCVNRDQFGELYRREIPGDEPLVMVKVIDSTPKYEGLGKGLSREEKVRALKENPAAFANYFIRVPPDIRTARDAVAWTFNQKPEAYNLSVET